MSKKLLHFIATIITSIFLITLVYYFNVCSNTITIDVKKLERANIKIINLTSGFNGSGTHIKLNEKSYILTSAHLFSRLNADKDVIFIVANDKLRNNDFTEKNEAALIFIDRKKDLALIKIKKKWNHPYLKVAKREPKIGEPVWVIGNPIILNDIITFGKIKDKKENIHVLNAKIFFGNSGGAVVNRKGEIVGVTKSVFMGFGYCIPFLKNKSVIISYSECVSLSSLKNFLKKVRERRKEDKCFPK